MIAFLFVGAIAVIAGIVYVEQAQRRILVQYPKRQQGNKVFGGESSHMPLKLNTSGVIPPIFASSLLLMPLTIALALDEIFGETLPRHLNRFWREVIKGGASNQFT